MSQKKIMPVKTENYYYMRCNTDMEYACNNRRHLPIRAENTP